MDTIVGTIWVCTSCMLVHANGECGEVHADSCQSFNAGGISDPAEPCDCGAREPLNLIRDGYSITMGLLREEHAPDCPNRSADHSADFVECFCGEREFSRSQCEGCGTYLHGTRYVMTLWQNKS
jgi:hypothetical protein